MEIALDPLERLGNHWPGASAEHGKRGGGRELPLRLAHLEQILAPLNESVQPRVQRRLLEIPAHRAIVRVSLVHRRARKVVVGLPRLSGGDGIAECLRRRLHVADEDLLDVDVFRAPRDERPGYFPEEPTDAFGNVIVLTGVPYEAHAMEDAREERGDVLGAGSRERAARFRQRREKFRVLLRSRRLAVYRLPQREKRRKVHRLDPLEHAHDAAHARLAELRANPREVHRARVPVLELLERAFLLKLARGTLEFVHDVANLPGPVNHGGLETLHEVLLLRGGVDILHALVGDVQHGLALEFVRTLGEAGEEPMHLRGELLAHRLGPTTITEHRGGVDALHHAEEG